MGRSSFLLPFVCALLLPSAAWAGGTVAVPPLIAKGVDPKVATNLTGLLSTELDFSGAFDTVKELPAAPASLNTTCLTSTSCMSAIAKGAEADALLTGTVGTGPQGLQVYLVLYDAQKNTVVRKKTFDVAADVASVAGAAPKFIRDMTASAPALAEEKAPAPDFSDEEEDDFAFEKSTGTKIAVSANPRDLEDEEDPEEMAAAAAKAKAEAKAKADADSRARAAAEAKAKAEADAKARAEAQAKAEAESRARAAAEAQARKEAQARAEADAKARAKAKPMSDEEEEDLEDELASFSFGGGGGAIVQEEEEAEEEAPRSFSDKYASEKTTKSKPAAKTTTTAKRIAENDEDEEFEPVEEDLDGEVDDLDEKPAKKTASRDFDEEEEEEARPTRRAREDDDVADLEEEENDRPNRSRSITIDGDEGEKPGVSVTARAGYTGYSGNLSFITAGAEVAVPVAVGVHVVGGIAGAWTERRYSDNVRQQIANEQGVDPEAIETWNAILPFNLGVQYKATATNLRPYGGVDLTLTPYTSDFKMAFGVRGRGGLDFMLIKNLGLNADAQVGFMAGDEFALVQKDLPNLGMTYGLTLGTALVF